nr:VOC family protein [Gemmatimonadaceae bacterium]
DGTMLRWRTLAPFGDASALLLPFYIEWGAGTRHPSTDSPAGCTLAGLALVSPRADSIRARVTAAALPVPVRDGATERLVLTLDCPRGRVTFD